jgi:hypothetical protein
LKVMLSLTIVTRIFGQFYRHWRLKLWDVIFSVWTQIIT